MRKVQSSKFQFPSTKHQVPSSKFQAPISKHQVPNSKSQIPSFKFQIPSEEESEKVRKWEMEKVRSIQLTDSYTELQSSEMFIVSSWQSIMQSYHEEGLKLQVPIFKHQFPSTKLQVPNSKSQISSFKFQVKKKVRKWEMEKVRSIQ